MKLFHRHKWQTVSVEHMRYRRSKLAVTHAQQKCKTCTAKRVEEINGHWERADLNA